MRVSLKKLHLQYSFNEAITKTANGELFIFIGWQARNLKLIIELYIIRTTANMFKKIWPPNST